MPQFTVIDRAGADFPMEGAGGSTLMEAIRDAGFQDQFALCGGNCSCATCHVYFEQDVFERLPAMSSDEDEVLSGSDHRHKNSRLSCQVALGDSLDGARITIAPDD